MVLRRMGCTTLARESSLITMPCHTKHNHHHFRMSIAYHEQYETLVIPALTDTVNKCFTYGMPSKMKLPIVTPLNDEEPIFYMCKLIEKVVAAHLIDHLQRKHLQEPLQSAYDGKNCSIETAVLKFQNDIVHILDK